MIQQHAQEKSFRRLYGQKLKTAMKSFEAGHTSFQRDINKEPTWLDYDMVEALHTFVGCVDPTRSLFEQFLEASHTEVADWTDETGDGDLDAFAQGFLRALCVFYHDVMIGFDEDELDSLLDEETQAVVVN